MTRILPYAAPALAFALTLLQHWPAHAADGRASGVRLERGRYIVEAIAGCGDCHTPRDRRGASLADRRLMGAPIEFAPLHPMPAWATRSPALAGLPAGYSESQLATFLQTGRKPNGGLARPPMPAFRMDAADARAVAAYLRRLR